MLRILQICPDYPRGSELLAGNIWDCLEAVKSQIVWDFSNIWKPGLKIMKVIILFLKVCGKLENSVYCLILLR